MTNRPPLENDPVQIPVGTRWPDQRWIDHITGEHEIRPPHQEFYTFGNPDVPVALYRDQINETVWTHQATILSSAPGNGKSIYNKQFFYESGHYRRIFQTQPRILPTRENARYAQQVMEQAAGHDMGDIIGYRTAHEGDAMGSSHVIREHTDGYLLQQLLHQLQGGDNDVITKDDLLIIDEAHERNPNIDIVLALALKLGLRVLIQSATIDTEKFARYCSRVLGGVEVPILELPGTMYPVQKRIGGEMHEEIIKYARMGRDNPLGVDGPLDIGALLPGAHDRQSMHSRIARRVGGYAILHLYGDQSAAEQQRSFRSYPGGKIVLMTDVGRTSTTIPGLHVMLDGGYHKTNDFRASIRYLSTRLVTSTAIDQGTGRVGRTEPGIYVDVSLPGYPPKPRDSQGQLMVDEYDTPPIQRIDLMGHYLKLMAAGESFESLDLMDMPRQDNIEHAKRQAIRIGAVAVGAIEKTEIGKAMERFSSLDPMFARMLVEAHRYGKKVEVQAAAMLAACQQDGGITVTEQNAERWRQLTRENRSDMLVQLDIMAQAIWMDNDQRGRYNIVNRRLKYAENLLLRLCDDLNLDINALSVPNEEERRQLIGCIITGCDTLFTRKEGGGQHYSNNEGFEGRLPKSTTVNGHQLMIGTPYVLEHYRNKKLKSHRIIKYATTVSAELLEKHAPWRCQYVNEQYHVDEQGSVYKSHNVYFDGKELYDTVYGEAEPSIQTTRALLHKLFYDPTPQENASAATKEIYAEAARLKDLLVDRSDGKEHYDHILESVVIDNVSKWGDVKVNQMYQLAQLLHKSRVHEWLRQTLSAENHETQTILRNSPNQIVVEVNDELIEITVEYRQNKAFLNIPLAMAKYLDNDEVVEALGGRQVGVWVDDSHKNHLILHNAIAKAKAGNRATRRQASRRKV